MPAPEGRVAPQLHTSPIFKIRGQQSRYRYPDERMTPEQCVKLTNINKSEFGTADTRAGLEKYHATAVNNPPVGLLQQDWSTGTAVLIVTKDKVYLDDQGTEITGSLSLTAGGDDDYYSFAFIRDQVVACNGKDEIWVKDNDVVSSPSNAAALTFSGDSTVTIQTCDALIEHKGTLLALAPTEGGTKFRTRIRWSDLDTLTMVPTITNWPDANRYELGLDGESIVGGVENFGVVLVFKADGLYPVHLEYNIGFIEIRPDTTVRGFHPLSKSIVTRPEFVACVAREGLVVIRPDLSYEVVTLGIMDEWLQFNQSRLQYAQGWVSERDHQVKYLMSSSGNTSSHDEILVWDWDTNDLWVDEVTTNINQGATYLDANVEKDLLGDVDGGLLISGTQLTDDDGTGFDWVVHMNPNDLGYPGRTKNIINLRTIYRGRDGQQSATLEVERDQGRLANRLKTVNFASALLTWNGGDNWDTGLRWQTGRNEHDVFFVNRHAEVIAPRWTGNDPVTLIGYSVEFQLFE